MAAFADDGHGNERELWPNGTRYVHHHLFWILEGLNMCTQKYKHCFVHYLYYISCAQRLQLPTKQSIAAAAGGRAVGQRLG